MAPDVPALRWVSHEQLVAPNLNSSPVYAVRRPAPVRQRMINSRYTELLLTCSERVPRIEMTTDRRS